MCRLYIILIGLMVFCCTSNHSKKDSNPIVKKTNSNRIIPLSIPKENYFYTWNLAMQNPENVLALDIIGFDSIPPEISRFNNLLKLSIIQRGIKYIPPTIGKCKKLKLLYAEGNPITELPSEIGELQNLEGIYLTRCDLTSLPVEMGNLSKLKFLFLGNNHIENIPSSFRNLLNLQILDISENDLSDTEKNKLREMLPHVEIQFE